MNDLTEVLISGSLTQAELDLLCSMHLVTIQGLEKVLNPFSSDAHVCIVGINTYNTCTLQSPRFHLSPPMACSLRHATMSSK